jgi:hypothetical protein
MTKSENGFAKQTIDEDSNLNIFEQIVNTSELVKILVTKELLIFKRIRRKSNVLFNWWGGEHETMFPFVDFFRLSNLRHYRIANGN